MNILNLENLMVSSQTNIEKTTNALRGIFALNGYRRYEMSSFESYELYHEHRDFLKSSGIITFNDSQGNLKALKPDVTLSIIKHTSDKEKQSKLYYIENVFRTQEISGNIREISQMGVEYIGGDDLYAEAEIIDMAVKCLSTICEDYVLTISHASFVTSFIDSLKLNSIVKENLLIAISEKNVHTLKQIAQSENCTQSQIDTLNALAKFNGTFSEVLSFMHTHICTDTMQSAYNSLKKLNEIIDAIGIGENIKMDFSCLSAKDAKYYNGIIMQGFIKGAPKAVLTGGRYDNLMHSFNKTQGAIGFAVNLSEISRASASNSGNEIHTVLVYEDNCKPQTILKALHKFQAEGKSVYAVNANKLSQTFKAKETYKLSENGEVELCLQ